MFNIVNFEIKRAFKSISTYILLVVFLILLFLPPIVIYYNIKEATSIEDMMMFGANDPGEVKVEIGVNEDNVPEVTHKEATSEELEKTRNEVLKKNYSLQGLFNNLSTSGPISIFFVIFVALMASKDYSSGFIKNLVTIKNYRFYQPFSKLIMAGIFSLILLGVALAGNALIAKLITGDLSLDWEKVAKFIGTVLVAQITITALISLIANYTNNQGATISIGLLLVMGIVTPILSLVDSANILPIKLMDYSLFNRYGGLFTGLDTIAFADKIKEILWLAVPMLVIYTIANILLLRRKDINLG